MQAPGGWRPLQPPTRPHSVDRSPTEASPFVRLARTHILSMAGDTIVTVALAGSLFFDLTPNQARGKVALSLVLTMAPFAVVAPFLGPLIDRRASGRRRMVLGAGAGRAVLAMFAAEFVHGVALFPLVFCLLVLSKAHAVAKAALVKATVGDDDELVRANSRLAVLGSLGGLAAALPAAAVLKLPFLGPGWVLRLAGLVFAIGAVAAVGLVDHRGDAEVQRQGPPLGVEGLAAPAEEGRAARPTVELFAPGIVRAATSMAVLRGTVGFLAFQIAFSFRRDHVSNAWMGLAVAACAIGNLAGSFVAPRLRSLVREEYIVLGALIGVSLAGVTVWRTSALVMAAGLALVVAVAAASARLAFDSLVQRDNGEAVQGRVFARFEACFQLVWVVGALLAVLIPFSRPYGGLVVALITGGGAVAYALELVAQHRARNHPSALLPAGGRETGAGIDRYPPPVATGVAPLPVAPTTEIPLAPTIEIRLPPQRPDSN